MNDTAINKTGSSNLTKDADFRPKMILWCPLVVNCKHLQEGASIHFDF